MAIPDNWTYKLTDVKDELQFTFGVNSMDYMINNSCCGAPSVSYDPAYSGTTSCLRNFRKYAYVTTYATTTNTRPRALAFDGTNVWAANYDCDSVSKITFDGTVTDYVCPTCLSTPNALAFDGTNMWVTNYVGDSITKVTPAGAMTTYAVANGPSGIVYDGTNMWTNNAATSVSKITPAGSVSTYTVSAFANSGGITWDGANIWVGLNDDSISKVTPAGTETNYPSRFSQSNRKLIFDGTYIWGGNNGSMTRITTAGVCTDYANGLAFGGLLWDGTHIWGNLSLSAYRINPSSPLTPEKYVTVPTYTFGSTFGCGFLWVGNLNTNSVTKIGVL